MIKRTFLIGNELNFTTRPRFLALFTAAALMLAGMFAGVQTASAQLVGIVDDGGANDTVGQNDLTRMAFDDSNPAFLEVTWSWDAPSAITGGGQAVNGCAMFDTDGDGNVNFSLCAEVSEDQDPLSPTFGQLVISMPPPPDGDTWFPHWIECSDAKDDRCTQPDRLGDPVDLPGGLGDTVCTVAVTATDPFDAMAPDGPGTDYPLDVELNCLIDPSLLPAAGSYEFVNVCSYPSAGNDGNNNPNDCVVTPGSGFLTIVKSALPDDATQFNFTLDPASNSGLTSFSINGSGQIDRIPVVKSSGQGSVGPYSLLEAVPDTWQLTDADCTTNGNPTGTESTTFPADGPTDAGLNGIEILPGQETICMFFNDIEAISSLATDKALLGNADEDGSGDVSAGDTLTYRITVTNTGTADLTNVTVDDDLTGTVDALCSASLPGGETPQASCFVDVQYVVTAADVTAGVINNSATGDSDQTDPVEDDENVLVPGPSLNVTKSNTLHIDADGSGDVSAGDTIRYSYAVENTGTANLTGVTISDNPLGAVTLLDSAEANGAGFLIPGETESGTLDYVVLATDLGTTITNIATADSDQTLPDTDQNDILVPTPSLSVDKPAPTNDDADGSGDVSPGDTLTYTVTATNNGSANLTNVVVSDPMITPTGGTTPCALVIPGGTCTLVGTYIVQESDLGTTIVNVGAADSDQTDEVTEDEMVVVPQAQTPELSVDKPAPTNDDTDSSGDVSEGDILTYTITATNTGNVDLTNVVVSDLMITPNTTTCAGPVIPGGTCVLVGTYVVTAADVTAGQVDNLGTADSDETDQVSDPETLILPTPSLETDKALLSNADEDGSMDVSAGDTLTYRITVENNGSANLTNVTVDDDLTGTVDALCAALLAPATNCFVDVTYVVTADDVTAGEIANTGTGDSTQTEPVDDIETESVPTPSLETNKALTNNADEDGSLDVSAGDTLTYTVTVTNNGSANLTNVVVSDSLITPNTTTCAFLAPTESCVLMGTYVVTADDVTAGEIANTGTGDSTQTEPVDDIETEFLPTPSLETDKALTNNADEDGSMDVSEGDTLTYRITVENNGSANLTNVTVDDDLTGTVDALCSALLAPAASCFVDVTYVVTAADVANGQINNTGTGDADQAGPVDDLEQVDLQNPSLETNKALTNNADEDGSMDVSEGDTLTYTVTVTNNGSANLTNVVVSDSLITPNTTTCAGPVIPGGTCVLVGTYMVKAADVANGQINNTGTGNADQAGPVDDIETEILPTPSLETNKTLLSNADEDGSMDVSEGDTLTYRITVENNGSANLTNVTVDDDLTGTVDALCSALLAPAASCFVDVTYVVTADDVTAGEIANTGTGDSTQTEPVDDIETESVPTPSLETNKALTNNADEDGSMDVSAGDTLTYTITVTNNGSANLTNVVVSDSLITPNTTTCAFLAPTESCVLMGTYVVTADDVTAGEIANTGTGDSTQTEPVDDIETEILPTPSLETDKALTNNADEDGSMDVSAGDTLTYTITATNNGSANLTNVVVSDTLITPNTTTCAFLAPAETCVLVGTYVVTAADVTAGNIQNTGSADSIQTDPVDDVEDVPVPSPSLTTDKLVVSIVNPDLSDGGSSIDQAGDKITYDIVVTNNGTANLTNVTVDDDLTGTVDAACAAFLAPGESCTVTVMYTATQDNLDNNGANPTLNGFIDNTGTADSVQTDPVSDSEQVPVDQNPSIQIVKTFADDSVIAGGAGSSFTLAVTNDGNVTLSDVVVTDMLDPDLNLTVTGIDCDGGTGPATGQNVSCTFAALNVGETRTITVYFTVASSVEEANGAGGLNDEDSFLNTAMVAAEAPQGNPDNTADDITGTGQDSIDILVEIELSITKSFYTIDEETGERIYDGPVEQGMNGFFELVVSNDGPSDAVNVMVTDAVDGLLGVLSITPQPECEASFGQDVNCTTDIVAGDSATVTVEYIAAEFLDPDAGPLYGTQEGDEFRIVFVNGWVLQGSTDSNTNGGVVYLIDPADGSETELAFNGTKNEIVFDPPFGASFTMHLSCSDAFTGGWGESAGPDEFDNSDWQIASYSILRYNNSGNFFKGCGDVVVPWDVDNTGFADGDDSNGEAPVSDTDTVQIIRQLKIETRNEPVAKGKKLDVLLNNTGQDSLTISQIEITWPNGNSGNGNLVQVKFGNQAIYLASEPGPTAVISGPWVGTETDRTIDPGEALKLAFFFAKKTKSGPYTVTVTLDGGLTTEVITISVP